MVQSIPLIDPLSAPTFIPIETLPLLAPVAPTRAPGGPNGYQAGQCTWHVKNRKPSVPEGWHDATDWKRYATAAGWTVSRTPVAGAVGWVYGHVVYVESVSGSNVTISEMNYDSVAYHQRTITVPATKYTYLY